MQQTQAQMPTPQSPRRRPVSRNVRIGIICVGILAILIFWILTIINVIPTLWGITADKLGAIAYAIIASLGAFFAFVPIIPVENKSEQTPTPATPNIVINIPPYQPVAPIPSSPPPDVPSVPTPPPSLTYRGMAQPPSTNPKTIQQRVNAVKEVYEKLVQPDISALVLVGIGGQGKSTLAALVYNYVEQQRKEGKGPFKGETLWLRVEENATFLTVAENIFTALGNKPSGFEQLPPQSQAYALVNVLNKLDPPLLIVLDQFENLLNLDTGEALTPETGELLDALNNGSCPSRILLTSRPRPKGIRMMTYDSLALYLVSDLTIAEGQALLKSRGVTNATDNDLQTAVQRCNGHSLALCLLASLLDENKLSLATLLNDPAYKQLWDKNVAEKLLAEIYKHLNDNQRELLHALSIYREAIPRDAIQALTSDTTKAQLDTLLTTLQAQQLVQVVEGDRRQLHPIVATYVQNYDEQFNKESTLLDHGKAAQYYVQQATKKCPPLNERKRISDVQPLVEAVWQFCQAEQWQEAYELMDEEYLFEDLRSWGGNVILLEISQSLLAGVAHFNLQQMLFVYHQLASVYCRMGQNRKALTYWKQNLDISKTLGDRRGEGMVLNNLGSVYYSLGQKQKTLKHYEQALAIFREVGDRESEGATLNNLGQVYNALKQRQKSLMCYEQALAISREVGNRGNEGVTLTHLGFLYHDLGQKQETLKHYEQALAIFREVGDRERAVEVLYYMGSYYYDEKRYDIALSCFILAKHIYVEVQNPDSESAQEWIDDVHQEIGDQPFTALLQAVEPHAQQIIDDALREIQG